MGDLPRIVCAWCDDVMQPGSDPVSHAICPKCVEKHQPIKTVHRTLQGELDSNPARVAVRRIPSVEVRRG